MKAPDATLGTLRRLLFANPLYGLTLSGRAQSEPKVTPPDPWPGDAEAGTAIVEGGFSLAGAWHAPGLDPWRSPPGGEAAQAVLHGFAWLRDLRALGTDAARGRARDLVFSWLDSCDDWHPVAWRPDVLGARLVNWLVAYGPLGANRDSALAQRLLRSLARQARHLRRSLTSTPQDGRAFAAIRGAIGCGMYMPGHEDLARAGLIGLEHQIDRQILPDGGLAERSPSSLLAVLKDLVDIRTMLTAGHLEVPEPVVSAIDRMAPMLRTLRYGDGRLGLFHGGSEEDERLIRTVLALSGARGRAMSATPHSGYQRVLARRTLVLMDCGSPPPPGLDRNAHAGTLGIEVSVGTNRLIVNCGADADDGDSWHDVLRATASHSTVVVDDHNSSEVLAGGGLGRRASPVTVERRDVDGCVLVEASHDGYAPTRALVHRRSLYVAAGGDDIRGEDVLTGRGRGAVAARFHLHPQVSASRVGDGSAVLLRPPSGAGWRFRAEGGDIALEDSIYAGVAGERRRTQQIVVSGPVGRGGAMIKWRLSREGG